MYSVLMLFILITILIATTQYRLKSAELLMFPLSNRLALIIMILSLICLVSFNAMAHGVDESTRLFLQNNTGVQFFPFMYIGAKHMVTGYDHLLFLAGVIFFLYKSKDILLYVSMFTLGHSLTLLSGVLGDVQVNAYIIDAIIGLSVVYKGFDNLGGFEPVSYTHLTLPTNREV